MQTIYAIKPLKMIDGKGYQTWYDLYIAKTDHLDGLIDGWERVDINSFKSLDEAKNWFAEYSKECDPTATLYERVGYGIKELL